MCPNIINRFGQIDQIPAVLSLQADTNDQSHDTNDILEALCVVSCETLVLSTTCTQASQGAAAVHVGGSALDQ